MIKRAEAQAEPPWGAPLPEQMAWVLESITDVDDMKCLLKDVMTEKEIYETSARLEAARLLASGARYTDIIDATQLSSRTVARVSDWLVNGSGGYGVAIKLLQSHGVDV